MENLRKTHICVLEGQKQGTNFSYSNACWVLGTWKLIIAKFDGQESRNESWQAIIGRMLIEMRVIRAFN